MNRPSRDRSTRPWLTACSGLLVILLSACTSTQQVHTQLQNRYLGQDFKAFVAAEGTPVSQNKLPDGGIRYVWAGSREVVVPPRTERSVVGNSVMPYYIGGGTLTLNCELDIRTDARDVIRDIRILKDTDGQWTTSACSRVLY